MEPTADRSDGSLLPPSSIDRVIAAIVAVVTIGLLFLLALSAFEAPQTPATGATTAADVLRKRSESQQHEPAAAVDIGGLGAPAAETVQ